MTNWDMAQFHTIYHRSQNLGICLMFFNLNKTYGLSSPVIQGLFHKHAWKYFKSSQSFGKDDNLLNSYPIFETKLYRPGTTKFTPVYFIALADTAILCIHLYSAFLRNHVSFEDFLDVLQGWEKHLWSWRCWIRQNPTGF